MNIKCVQILNYQSTRNLKLKLSKFIVPNFDENGIFMLDVVVYSVNFRRSNILSPIEDIDSLKSMQKDILTSVIFCKVLGI